MMRVRTVFLSVSVVVVLLFAGALAASRSSRDGLFRALGNLAEVVHLVETEYVDNLNQEALSLSLDAGLVESQDPWAAVLPADRIDDYLEFVESPPPFGLVLVSRLGSAAVRYVLSGSPAEEAGLQPWEVIERVEGVISRGRPLWQIRLELKEREKASEPVTLTVFDREIEERRQVVLSPSDWSPQAATSEIREGATVILVKALPEGAAEKIAAMVPQNGGVILDLRHLEWGREDEAIALADAFTDEGILGTWKGRRAGARTYEASEQMIDASPPLVLVGPETEGVGEVLAVALRRAGAVLVGQKTVGHAPHMSLVRDTDFALWLPVGLWMRLDGEPINGNGVEPTEVVEVSADESGDPVLDKALELLPGELKKAA